MIFSMNQMWKHLISEGEEIKKYSRPTHLIRYEKIKRKKIFKYFYMNELLYIIEIWKLLKIIIDHTYDIVRYNNDRPKETH